MFWVRMIGVLLLLVGGAALAAGLLGWRPAEVQMRAAIYGRFSVLPAWLILAGVCSLTAGALAVALRGPKTSPS